MAEWCYNRITFNGDEKNIKELTKILQDMHDRTTPEHGVIPIIQEQSEDSYYFYLSIESRDETCVEITYSTKWNPNHANINFLCIKFGVEMDGYFSEESHKIYGEYKFENGVYYVKELTDEEFDQCIVLRNDLDEEVIAYRKDYSEEDWNELTEQEDTSTDYVFELLDEAIDKKAWIPKFN